MAEQYDEADVAGQVEAFLNAWFRTRQYVMEANFHRAHQHGLSTTQFMLLGLLDSNSPCTLRSVADALNLETSTLVRTVDSLEQRGLVARYRSTVDRRQVHLTLTEAGQEVQLSSQEQFRSRLTAIFRAMQPADRRALIDGLTAFARAAQGSQETTHHE